MKPETMCKKFSLINIYMRLEYEKIEKSGLTNKNWIIWRCFKARVSYFLSFLLK